MTVVVQQPPAGPALLDVKQAAAHLNLGLRTLHRLTANGELSAVRIGRTVRYRSEDLTSFIERAATGKRRK